MTTKNGDNPMTWRQLGTLIAALAALTVVHAYLVVPRVIAESRKEWNEDIAKSIAPIHEDIREVKDRQVRIEDKIDALRR